MRTFTVALLLMAGLAGCFGGEDANASGDEDTPDLPVIGGLGEPWPSGQNARDLIESYIMTHPFRLHGPGTQTFMDTARDDLETYLVDLGTMDSVERHDYGAGINILGIQNGTTNPEQWVVLSAHYDTVGAGGLGPTVYGAWDDGAGTALLMELAASLGQWDFPFTVVYAFFDGEEKGLVGSKAFVADYFEDGEHDLVANLNTDPPGLNYPCGDPAGPFAVKVIQEDDKLAEGAMPRYTWLANAVASALENSTIPANALDQTAGIPVATALGQGVRGGSDHQSFGNVDVANVFLGGVPLTIVNGDPNENTAAVLTYGLHTPLDTLEQMEARCINGTLAGGLQTIADLFANTLAHMAETSVPVS